MAENFADAADLLGDQLREHEDEHRIRWHLARSLRYHRSFAFELNEKSRELTLVADQWQYGADDGLPGDIQRFVEVTIKRSTGNELGDWPVEPVSVSELRRLHLGARSSSSAPDKYTWFQRQLWLYPIPNAADTLIIDYYADATRDESTGVEIDEDSVEETNVFIREAEGMILARAAYTYALAVIGDPKKAQEWRALHQEEFQSLMRERDAKKLSGRQVGWYL